VEMEKTATKLVEVKTDFDRWRRWRERMIQLGRSHDQRGIPAKYLDLMGPTFCNAIRCRRHLKIVQNIEYTLCSTFGTDVVCCHYLQLVVTVLRIFLLHFFPLL
jgi:hypothetical protein